MWKHLLRLLIVIYVTKLCCSVYVNQSFELRIHAWVEGFCVGMVNENVSNKEEIMKVEVVHALSILTYFGHF